MKRIFGENSLLSVTAVWGITALVLRLQLYRTALDERNLLLRHHPLSIALLVLTVGALIRIILAVRKLDGSNRFEDNYSASKAAAVGHLAMAGGILETVLSCETLMPGYLGFAWRLLGMAAPACLVLAGAARMMGKKPFFLLHVVPCLFLVIQIVNHYQAWSGNPQMQDYVFALLGTMALMFFGFYTAAFAADSGNRRMTLGMGLAAVYLCLAELAYTPYPGLYLGGILWALTSMCSLKGVEKTDDEGEANEAAC